MNHHAHVKAGSLVLTPQGGVSFVVTCCGELERSAHVQDASKFSKQELKRLVEDEITAIQSEHESHLVVVDTVASILADNAWLDTDCAECPKAAPAEEVTDGK